MNTLTIKISAPLEACLCQRKTTMRGVSALDQAGDRTPNGLVSAPRNAFVLREIDRPNPCQNSTNILG